MGVARAGCLDHRPPWSATAVAGQHRQCWNGGGAAMETFHRRDESFYLGVAAPTPTPEEQKVHRDGTGNGGFTI